ncbi:MAG: rhomboid family intramembrane serine protease [Actinomycetia bacterium]|nr:rhomboid family intramembrane serine protease [Actinomycetes bacterium]
MTEQTLPTCYRHPDRITGLSCTTCGKSICVECSRDASVGQKCPECAAPQGRARVVNARQTFGRPSFQTAPVSFTIMAITVGIFVIGLLSADADRWLFQTFAQANFLVEAGEWWRIFTAALLHGGMMHVLFNMYALYLFGPRLEQQVGSPAFAALYVATAGTGGMVSYLFGDIQQVSIGASGAIFGLLGAWMFVAWKMRGTPGGRSMFNQLGVLLAINLALPLFVGGIDWRAHLGGLAGGILIAWLWSVLAVGRPNARTIRTIIAVGVAVGAAVTAMIV